jgi:hypothetical protein
LAEGRKTKTPQAFWRPAAIGLVKILSQPQVRANRAKPIKEILAAGCVVHLLAVHETKVTGPHPLSSQGGSNCSADWQSAVSPNDIRQGAVMMRALRIANPRHGRLSVCVMTALFLLSPNKIRR